MEGGANCDPYCNMARARSTYAPKGRITKHPIAAQMMSTDLAQLILHGGKLETNGAALVVRQLSDSSLVDWPRLGDPVVLLRLAHVQAVHVQPVFRTHGSSSAIIHDHGQAVQDIQGETTAKEMCVERGSDSPRKAKLFLHFRVFDVELWRKLLRYQAAAHFELNDSHTWSKL